MGRALLLLFLFIVFSLPLFGALFVYMFMDTEKGETVILGWVVPVWVQSLVTLLVLEMSILFAGVSGAMFLNNVSRGRLVSDATIWRLEQQAENKVLLFSIIFAPPFLLLLLWGFIETWLI